MRERSPSVWLDAAGRDCLSFSFLRWRGIRRTRGSARHADFPVGACGGAIYSFYDHWKSLPDARPTGGKQHHDRQVTTCEVLLVLEVSICGYENFKSCCLSSSDQISVLKFRPSAFICRLDRMGHERPSKRRRRALIKKHLHSGDFEGAAGSVFEYGSGLLGSDPRKPFNEIVKRGVIFQVFEERRDGHASTCKYPGTAHAAGVSLNDRAGRPVNHVWMVAPRLFCVRV